MSLFPGIFQMTFCARLFKASLALSRIRKSYRSYYTQQQKKRKKSVTFKLIRIKYVEFKKYILHVKLTVYYTVSFTCDIHFVNSTFFYIFNQFKSNKFGRFFCCWVYINWGSIFYLKKMHCKSSSYLIGEKWQHLYK